MSGARWSLDGLSSAPVHPTSAVAHVNSQRALILTDMTGMWVDLGSNILCDMGAGEVYRGATKLANVEQCQEKCQDLAECQSITYFESNGLCACFSSLCTKTKKSKNTVSRRRTKNKNSENFRSKSSIENPRVDR